MSMLRPRSLQLQLALRLGLLFFVATALAVGALLVQTYGITSSMSEQNLIVRANELARAVSEGGEGAPVFTLPARLATSYDAPAEVAIFAIRDAAGNVIAASGAPIRALAATWPVAHDEPRFFRLESFGTRAEDYYGLDVRLATVAGPLSVTVAEAGDTDAFLHAMLSEFLFDVAWIIPAFIAATLLVGVLAIRQGLAPLREASALAATIEPRAISVRLPTEALPAEIVPLVGAINRALERLEEGFALQRRFTANAAHELRTPLAIITGALDGMEGDGNLSKLRQDVSRMNRLVEQLLRAARLDGVALDVSDEVDLRKGAADVVEYMAPLAIEQDRSIAFAGPDQPVRVRGNRHAIEDALRNLIENAITHTAVHTEVIVETGEDKTISVCDRGPGIPSEDRERLFDRFWRGKDSRNAGAGLGLSIVKEIMKAHGGHVSASNNPGGGAKFTLHF
ncbi:MAG TPA: HAMP domain-containing sensor histidine kinase [Gammaproteobacteria bacterium]